VPRSTDPAPAARFTIAGTDAYEPAVGRWSRRLAPLFADFCAPVAGRVLDVGCGTGILTAELLRRGDVAAVAGIDVSAELVASARAAIPDPRASFQLADAAALPFADASFDHALSLLVVNFLDDRPGSVREAIRVTRPGGTVAATVWDMRGGFVYARLPWDVAAARDPAAAGERDRQLRTRFLRPGSLAALWSDAGLADIRTASLAVDITYADFADFWEPLLASGQTFARYLGALAAPAQAELEAAIRAAYLVGDIDGPRSYAARAFAVAGRVLPG
jgi:SAM-dependent methyltransferase